MPQKRSTYGDILKTNEGMDTSKSQTEDVIHMTIKFEVPAYRIIYTIGHLTPVLDSFQFDLLAYIILKHVVVRFQF